MKLSRSLATASLAAALAALGAAGAQAQTMSIEEYEPKSTLVVPEHHPSKAKYPFIDVHNHQDRDMSAEEAAKLVADMDRIGMKVMVNLSGGAGRRVREGTRKPGRPLSRSLRRLREPRLHRHLRARAGASGPRRSSREDVRPAPGA